MTIKIVVTVGSLIVGLTSYYVFKKPDTTLEEVQDYPVAEEIIKHQTNWDIDLTPQTKERQ